MIRRLSTCCSAGHKCQSAASDATAVTAVKQRAGGRGAAARAPGGGIRVAFEASIAADRYSSKDQRAKRSWWKSETKMNRMKGPPRTCSF
jgi:hypothetical protein